MSKRALGLGGYMMVALNMSFPKLNGPRRSGWLLAHGCYELSPRVYPLPSALKVYQIQQDAIAI
jgi:hypothetical protein